jgi:hypothetical protein
MGFINLRAVFSPWRDNPLLGLGLHPHSRGVFFISHRHATVGRTPLDEWSAGRRGPLPDNTQHSQQTDIHVPGGIRTHDLSRRVAIDLRLRSCGHWDQQFVFSTCFNVWAINILVLIPVYRETDTVGYFICSKISIFVLVYRRIPWWISVEDKKPSSNLGELVGCCYVNKELNTLSEFVFAKLVLSYLGNEFTVFYGTRNVFLLVHRIPILSLCLSRVSNPFSATHCTVSRVHKNW